jgi:glycosyltransferase involved in cell wall biosynthesis
MDKIHLPEHLISRIGNVHKWQVPRRILIIFNENFYPLFKSSELAEINNLIGILKEDGYSIVLIKININNVDGPKASNHLYELVNGVRLFSINFNNAKNQSEQSSPVNSANRIFELVNIFKPSFIITDLAFLGMPSLSRQLALSEIPYALILDSSGVPDPLKTNNILTISKLCIAQASKLWTTQRQAADAYLEIGYEREKISILECDDGSQLCFSNAILEYLNLHHSSQKPKINLKDDFHIDFDSHLGHGKLDLLSLGQIRLASSYHALTVILDQGATYKVSGKLVDLKSVDKNPALIRFLFEDVKNIDDLKVSSGLSHSINVGFYKYLQPIDDDGNFEFNVALPTNENLAGIEIRTWGKYTNVFLDEVSFLLIGRQSKLTENDINDLEAKLERVGYRDLRKEILSNSKEAYYLKADKIERLFHLMFFSDVDGLDQLVYDSFEMDPLPVRGRRLIEKALERGMLKVPAKIAIDILNRGGVSGEEKKRLKRVVSRWRISDQAISLPKIEKKLAYSPNNRNSLYFMYSCLPYQSNGYATRTHSLLQAVKNEGTREVIPYSRPGYPWDLNFKNHLALDYDQVDNILYRHLNGVNLFQQELDHYFEASSQIVQAVAMNNCSSVLHAASNYINAIPVLMAARRLGLPFIYEIRGFWELSACTKFNFDWSKTEAYKNDFMYETLVAKNADAVVVITNKLKDELINRGVDSNKITVIANGVDSCKFKPLNKNLELKKKIGLHDFPTIGFIGSFVNYEGLDDLVSSAIQMRKGGLNFNLLLVGDGPEMSRIEELVVNGDLSDITFITGRVPFDEVENYYSLIDIAPFPRKPFTVCEMVSPLKPFEAMAMGKIVVASNVSAMIEFIDDGVTGVLFEKGSVDSLTNKLTMVIKDFEAYIPIGETSREWVITNRSWRKLGQELTDLHNHVLRTHFGLVE